MASREDVRRLATESIARGDATGWFEALYQSAGGTWTNIPWVNLSPNPLLVDWLASSSCSPEMDASGLTCLVIGCGLGDDAEALSAIGFDVTAFDVSSTAIDGCRSRFPRSSVEYAVADVFELTRRWSGRFDLVFEANTLQVLPADLRAAAIKAIAGTVALDGRLLVICRARDQDEAEGQFPWPLTHEELNQFCAHGLIELEFECDIDEEVPPVRRFRVLYGRPCRLE